MPLSCRFYKHKFPECDEVVMVNVRQIAEMGSYVNLLEYNKIEGERILFINDVLNRMDYLARFSIPRFYSRINSTNVS
jgi:hypothetical protein